MMAEEGRSGRRVRWGRRVVVAGWRRRHRRRVVYVGVRVRVRVRVRQGVLMGVRGEEEGRCVRRRMRRRRRHRGTVDIQARILLLPFGPSILEPDLHLGLGQLQLEREVQPLAHGQVSRSLELVLQPNQLLVREGRSRSSGFTAGVAAASAAPATTARAVLTVLTLTLTVLHLDAARRGGRRRGLPLLAVCRGCVGAAASRVLSPDALGILIHHPHFNLLVFVLLLDVLLHLLHDGVRCTFLIFLAAAAGEFAPRVAV